MTIGITKSATMTVKELESENAKLREDISYISTQWKRMIELKTKLCDSYVHEVEKNKSLEKTLQEVQLKCERTAIFLSVTEKARNNLENVARRLRSELDAINAEKSTGGPGSVLIGNLDEEEGPQIKVNATEEDDSEVATHNTSAKSNVILSTTASLKNITPANLVLNSRLNTLSRTCEELKRDNEKKMLDITQLKAATLRFKTRLQEEEFFRSVLEKRIAVMTESSASKLADIEELQASYEMKEEILAKQVAENDTLLNACEKSKADLLVQGLLLEQRGMELEDTHMRLIQFHEKVTALQGEVKLLGSTLKEVKREDPILLQQLRFEIVTLSGQRNHFRTKATAIGQELKKRLNETRKVLAMQSKLQAKLEEATNEREAFRDTLKLAFGDAAKKRSIFSTL